ncbi:MAG: hypothetical protein EA415_07950 [Sphaerobacteraceae bacterium]|nr:MAG: hypothetical protein EA415_07950 [Sphaerobacteraceae bacterium]
MFDLKRLTRLFSRSRTGISRDAFEFYYGSVLTDHRNGGVNAREARQDFEQIRHAVDRTSTL